MEMDEYYNSHKITVRSGQQDAGKWTCQYVVVKFGYTDMGKRSGYAEVPSIPAKMPKQPLWQGPKL
jgi:hypothetical protein